MCFQTLGADRQLLEHEDNLTIMMEGDENTPLHYASLCQRRPSGYALEKRTSSLGLY